MNTPQRAAGYFFNAQVKSIIIPVQRQINCPGERDLRYAVTGNGYKAENYNHPKGRGIKPLSASGGPVRVGRLPAGAERRERGREIKSDRQKK
jgi:hypothetical protein